MNKKINIGDTGIDYGKFQYPKNPIWIDDVDLIKY